MNQKYRPGTLFKRKSDGSLIKVLHPSVYRDYYGNDPPSDAIAVISFRYEKYEVPRWTDDMWLNQFEMVLTKPLEEVSKTNIRPAADYMDLLKTS